MTARRIAIIGDGQMGRAVESLARTKGWDVTAVIGENANVAGRGITKDSLKGAEVAIEFTQPDAAESNIRACLEAGCAIVAGTTGWHDSLPALTQLAKQRNGALLWSANFSTGVNIFLEIARRAAELMRASAEFDAHIVETHHNRKKDAPSGTAIAIERVAREALGREVPVTSVRTGAVPGVHELIFDAPFEQIQIIHSARDRQVFADGALRAAEWLIGRKGVFTMRDVLGLGEAR